jgi:dihydrofolate reductase
MISIIAAIGKNNEIGADNNLLWHLPNDLKRFKELTTNHTIIMGRKTFDSLPKGALPNRTNVVISRNPDFKPNNCIIFSSLKEALGHFKDQNEIFVIGGASIYLQALDYTEKLYLTKVYHTFEKAETFFPEINKNEWIKLETEDYLPDARHPFSYTFETLIKKNKI